MSQVPPTSSIKLLLIAYYWPPSGGMGVQRWLRMSSQLVRLGVDVHVLTLDPESAHYPTGDSALLKEVDPRVHVTHVKAFNPFVIAKKLLGNGVPQTGFSSEGKSNFWLQVMISLRSHLFIPDPRKTWNRRALLAAKAIIDEQGIQFVVTSSPPQSVHLIGQALKKSRSIQWIADFRDPWTDIFYYKDLLHSPVSEFLDRRLERSVLDSADAVVAVTPSLKALLAQKIPLSQRGKFSVITNGYDGEDLEQTKPEEVGAFHFLYTGTLIESYQVEVLFESLARVIPDFPEMKIEIVGGISVSYERALSERFSFIEFKGVLPHEAVTEKQKSAGALILVGPEGEAFDGHIPGKTFEYLRTGIPILHLGREGSDVAKILRSCSAGRTFNRRGHETQMDSFIRSLVDQDEHSYRHEPNWGEIRKFHRSHISSEFLQLMRTMTES